eukprot:EG_transcript_19916
MFFDDVKRFVATGCIAIAAGACVGLALSSPHASATFEYATPAIRVQPVTSVAVPATPSIAHQPLGAVQEVEQFTIDSLEAAPSEGFSIQSLAGFSLVPIAALAGFFLGARKAKEVILDPVDMCAQYNTYSMLSVAGDQVAEEPALPKAPVKVETSYAKIIENIEKKYLKEEEIPNVQIGDTVTVGVRIKEGDRERVQDYTGVIIAIRNGGLHKSIRVRAVLQGIGVERIFPLHCRQVAYIRILKRAKVRRAKLFYLRDLAGKAARLKQRFGKKAAL